MANIKISKVGRRDIENPEYLNMFINVDDKTNIKQVAGLKREQKKSKFYFTKDYSDEIIEEDEQVEENPFKLPQILKDEKCFARLKRRIKDGHTYNSRFGKNIRARLRIPSSPSRIMTIDDVDPEFFSLVESRPVKYPFNKDLFIRNIRDTMLYRLEAGYQEDGILQMEEKIKAENVKFKHACENHNSCVADFERFLHDDYESAVVLMNKAKNTREVLENKREEYRRLHSSLEKLKRQVYILEDECRKNKIYKDFLYTVSPLSWCQENSVQFEKIGKSFSKYDIVKESGSIMSLDSLISLFERDFCIDSLTKLYFTEPKQLAKILDDIVMQNLNSWSNAEKLTVNVQKLDLASTGIKSRIQQEHKETAEQISDMESAIRSEETKAETLKQKATDVINRHFYNTVASPETLKLHVCVKDVFETLLFQSADFSTHKMMTMVEEEYENNMRELDAEDLETVKKAEREIFRDESKAMQAAKVAADKLHNLNKINNKLKIALQPPKKWQNIVC